MVLRPIDDTKLGAQALAYVIELYRELTAENGAPTLGTQNQAVDFIRSNPELRKAATREIIRVAASMTANIAAWLRGVNFPYGWPVWPARLGVGLF
jgi:antirestriction protein ArdC